MEVEGYPFPEDRWYHPREHLWCLPERGDGGWLVTVGLDAMAQAALGEVVYVQLAEPGGLVEAGDPLGTLEAEKMVRPVLAPVSGRLREVNGAVPREPRLLNQDPYGRGWLFRIEAPRWEAERPGLLHGEAALVAWARAELEAMKEGG
jgi:glycine cleavage system H protein